MRATEITKENFDDTIQETLNQKLHEYLTYYLDRHEYEGGTYFTVSSDEVLLGCWTDFQSACHLFHALPGELPKTKESANILQ